MKHEDSVFLRHEERFLGTLDLEDKETTFFGKVGNKLLSDAVSYSTKMHSSATLENHQYAFYFFSDLSARL
jgi:hypothetical protein